MQSLAVDLRVRDHLHGDLGRGGEHGSEERLPVLRADLLRVVQLRERANAVVAQRFVVEKDACDDGGPASEPRPASSAPATKRAPSLGSNLSSLSAVLDDCNRLFCRALCAEIFFGSGLVGGLASVC